MAALASWMSMHVASDNLIPLLDEIETLSRIQVEHLLQDDFGLYTGHIRKPRGISSSLGRGMLEQRIRLALAKEF